MPCTYATVLAFLSTWASRIIICIYRWRALQYLAVEVSLVTNFGELVDPPPTDDMLNPSWPITVELSFVFMVDRWDLISLYRDLVRQYRGMRFGKDKQHRMLGSVIPPWPLYFEALLLRYVLFSGTLCAHYAPAASRILCCIMLQLTSDQ